MRKMACKLWCTFRLSFDSRLGSRDIIDGMKVALSCGNSRSVVPQALLERKGKIQSALAICGWGCQWIHQALFSSSQRPGEASNSLPSLLALKAAALATETAQSTAGFHTGIFVGGGKICVQKIFCLAHPTFFTPHT